MIGRFFQNIEVGLWTEISAVIFMVIFAAIFLWVYLPQRKSVYKAAANIPLRGE